MACECMSEKETAEKVKETVKKKGPTDHLLSALEILDKEQEQCEPDSKRWVELRQSREKLKALIKFIDARI